MENTVFFGKSQSFKKQKLERVIYSKLSTISAENVQTIVRTIDVDKQYFIKATRNCKRFLNIVTEEVVDVDSKEFKSSCQIIYGDLAPGRFENINGEKLMVSGDMDKTLPAAAVKTIVSRNAVGKEKFEFMLVLYEPMSENGGRTSA